MTTIERYRTHDADALDLYAEAHTELADMADEIAEGMPYRARQRTYYRFLRHCRDEYGWRED